MAALKGKLGKLYTEVKDRVDKALEDTAYDLTFEIESAFESAIDAFYAHYEPTIYDRTFATYQASNAGLHGFKSTIKRTSSGYTAGITVDSSNLGHPYRADTDWVFERTFVKGYHGFNANEARIWSSRQWDEARHMAFGYGIRLGRMPAAFHTKATVMRPTPKTLLDRAYKKISKPGHIQAVFDSHFKSK